MTENKTDIYLEDKKRYYTQPEVLALLEKKISWLCETTRFTQSWRIAVRCTFELLCLTLETPQGRELYIRLLNHIAPRCPGVTKKYRAVFDKHENLVEKYG